MASPIRKNAAMRRGSRRKTPRPPLPVLGIYQQGAIVINGAGQAVVLSFSDLLTLIGGLTGPATSTDNGIPRYDGVTGDVLLDTSGPTMPDDGRIANVTDPTDAQDAATKAYVDAQVAAGSGSGTSLGPVLPYTNIGDGVTTTFDLTDVADYLLLASVAGAVVDPATYSLSADRTQITFTSAPANGAVITVLYVQLIT